MKTIDLFCASPASTAICSSLDQRSTVRHGTRPIDHRHRRILGDTRKYTTPIPSSSQLPIDPKLYFQKSRKSSSKQSDIRRKSSADISDMATPNGSSRYLLSETPFFDLVSDSEHVRALVPSQSMRVRSHLSSNDSQFNSTKPCSEIFGVGLSSSKDSPSLKSSSTRSRHRDQVVELRVSIHCKGCEGKVRKHISRMEGVTSFSIDLATKKVTIIGDVTPLGVLTSISRVKNAQFWPSPTSSSPSSSSSTPLVGQRY